MIFESIDKKLRKIGFIKVYEDRGNGRFVSEDKYGVSYERWIEEYKYTQVLDIRHKTSGKHLIQSFQKNVNADGFNNTVGLSYEETKLAMKKYRQMKRRYNWK
ncbi:MAG: hypothetical protein HFG89_00400 [Dorea sp.]|jgi:hypothetical protein|nr:hypothetical protein [Dorea sp.]